MTEEDILFRVKLDQLQTKLTQKITKDKGKISDEDIEEYYDKNKERFAQPERRDLNVVLTKTEAKANEAKQQLEDGESFKAVAKEFSIDEASKAPGRQAARRGQGPAGEGARRGRLRGREGRARRVPSRPSSATTSSRSTKITPASQQSLEQAKETIRNLLRSQREQKALDEFVKDFREKYKDDTNCADDYVSPSATTRRRRSRHRPGLGWRTRWHGTPQGARRRAPAPQGAAAGRAAAGARPPGAQAPPARRRRRRPARREPA